MELQVETWPVDPARVAEIRDKIERAIPDENTRLSVLRFLAYAIENADEERSDAWCLRETSRGLALMTGRLLACKVTRGGVKVRVLGPLPPDTASALNGEAIEAEEWKKIPGVVFLILTAEKAKDVLDLLKNPFNQFVDQAMARVRRTVDLDTHVPEAVAYLSGVIGRELPQPEKRAVEPSDEDDDEVGDSEEAGQREPRVRGRAPIFEHGQRAIGSLIEDIDPERGAIALPDLQRPFVWEDTQVRELLDSLFIGFPVGTRALWHTADEKDARALGAARRGLRATTLVIDGQQRLTSLYAVMRGKER